MREIEILAPAGSLEAARAAWKAGADAVYIGGQLFGARAYADNPDTEGLLRAIDYAHLHGRKLYLTVNTLLKNDEISSRLYDYLLPFYREGLDAVLVQDTGVLVFLRENFPGLPLHASTQMTVTGPRHAGFLKGLGVARIVAPRELSLKELQSMKEQTAMELEVFVQGALCYCYSGQCLMSSMIGGRSGNRGRCAQPCRLDYTFRVQGSSRTGALISPRDLCALQSLPDLIDAGVDSLKIEGRMKKPEYAAFTAWLYRRYADLYLEKGRGAFSVRKKDLADLLDLFDRGGFTDGYFFRHNGPEMMTDPQGRPSGRIRSSELSERIEKAFLRENELKEPASGRALISRTRPVSLEVSCGGITALAQAEPALSARSRPLSEADVRKHLTKTGTTPFTFGQLQIQLEEGCFLPVTELNQLRRQALESLEEKMLAGWRRPAPEGPRISQPGPDQAGAGRTAARPALCALVSSQAQLDVVIRSGNVCRVYVNDEGDDAWLRGAADACGRAGIPFFVGLPNIVRDSFPQTGRERMGFYRSLHPQGYLIRSLESLFLLEEAGLEGTRIADCCIYHMNDLAGNLGQKYFDILTLPLELNKKELDGLQFYQQAEMIGFGYFPVMISAQCLVKNCASCRHEPGLYYLRDRRHMLLPVRNVCSSCCNIIYNPVPLFLPEAMQPMPSGRRPAYCRLQFLDESAQETAAILAAFEGTGNGPQHYTKGHYNRGVM